MDGDQELYIAGEKHTEQELLLNKIKRKKSFNQR